MGLTSQVHRERMFAVALGQLLVLRLVHYTGEEPVGALFSPVGLDCELVELFDRQRREGNVECSIEPAMQIGNCRMRIRRRRLLEDAHVFPFPSKTYRYINLKRLFVGCEQVTASLLGTYVRFQRVGQIPELIQTGSEVLRPSPHRHTPLAQ